MWMNAEDLLMVSYDVDDKSEMLVTDLVILVLLRRAQINNTNYMSPKSR